MNHFLFQSIVIELKALKVFFQSGAQEKQFGTPKDVLPLLEMFSALELSIKIGKHSRSNFSKNKKK